MHPAQRTFGNLCSKRFVSRMSIKSQKESQEEAETQNRHEPKDFKIKNAPKLATLAHRLRLAIYEGKSVNLKKNDALGKAMTSAIEQGMPRNDAQKILENFRKENDHLHTHLIQIRYMHKIYVIITACSESLQNLQLKLKPTLERYEAAFGYVMPFFNNTSDIEALVSFKTAADFQNLENTLKCDGRACKARSIEMLDSETGAVSFKCNPMELLSACKILQQRKYVILHVAYDFVPKSRVILCHHERQVYEQFLKRIWKLTNILNVYDNVNKKSL
ncbi:uncharacterized protein LOC119675486 [Teleopsis dalmanni]|uniref:uncharacterized protein LOC119675477 n=1 Tax=Teleopsis dalmanni TaxID=139649 RepID=UPI0018CE893D|nr:uncharacterized protein LOC119675477 [Teleopsis dalmanni]XP_037942621.1 uncharacterized protein LOC119675486 [Teleopsis dalmanni]